MLDLDPLLFNPAYSGFFDASARFGVVYRNQWASVSAPFQTLSATAELSIFRNAHHRNGLSGGLWLTADRAGSLGYGTTAASAIASYYQGFGNGNHILSVAAEAGIGQVGFSTENISMPDGTEDFSRTRALYPTFGAGIAWFCQINDQLYSKVGLAMRNINEPDISHLDMSDDARLSRRFNIYARAEWQPASQWGILPVLGFQHQRNFSELVYGCDFRHYFQSTSNFAVGAGIMGRHGDAAAVNLALLWQEWIFAFSYDANLSRLATASHTIGAFEVGVVYTADHSKRNPRGSHSRGKNNRSIPCPVF